MTLPNGAAGLATIGLEFAFTNDGSIPGAVDRTRDAIEGVLKADILASPGWGGAHDVAYDGLPSGVPLFLGQIMRMAQELTGLPIEDWGTPVLGMIDDVFGVIGTFSARLKSLFGSLNFLQEGGWNPIEMIGEWLENDILPLGFIAELIDGLIPDLNIPGLDASKIISGSFPMEMINGLLDFLADVPVLGTILGWFGLDPDGDESDLQGFLGGLLGEDSPLNALNLFNLPGILGSLNIGALTSEAREELIAPTMDYVENIVGGNVWQWDGVDGRTSPGCVTTTGAGIERVLKSNPIAVAPGQPFNIHAYAKWSGLTYAGSNPIQLRVRRFLNYVSQGVDMIAAIASPGASGGWTQMVDTEYEVPVGCDMIVVEFYVSDMVTAGTIKFDDASAKRTGSIQMGWVSGLLDQLGGLGDFAQSILDTALSALTGSNVVGGLVENLLEMLSHIPFMNVDGVAGPADIGSSVLGVIDQLVSGFLGVLGGSGAGLPDIFNTGQEISSRASRGAMAFDITAIRNNNNLNSGFLPTTQSNIGLDRVALQSTAPTFAITQSTAICGYQIVKESGLKGVVSFQAYYTGVVTDCYINIYKMNTTTGVNDLVHSSTNQFGLLSPGSVPVPVVYSFTPIDTLPGEAYGIEVAIRGAGTLNIAGAASWLQDQVVYPRRYSSVRNSGVTGPPSSFTPTYGSNVPFMEFGVSASPVVLPQSPVQELVNTPTTTTKAVPAWCNEIDIIEVAAGGGGWVGSGPPTAGEGGGAGEWKTVTWKRGIDWDAATNPVLTVVVGDGGLAKGPGTGSDNGQNTSVTLPATTGHSAQTLTAAGGGGGNEWVTGSARDGLSPGNITYKGIPYQGGLRQTTADAAGSAPGGGGAGGATSWGAAHQGGKGAPGAAWVRYRQS